MDDIYEKLHLLEYLTKFCKTRGHIPLSKTYFAINQHPVEDEEQKVKHMVELCYWLMSLSFEEIQR